MPVLEAMYIFHLYFTFQEFTTSMFLRQEWTDIRLAHGLDGTISLGGKDVDMIWRPDTYINNNNDYELHQENQLALISKYGEVYFSARYDGTYLFKKWSEIDDCQM